MADEGQKPRYSSTSSCSNQVVQETNEASSTQDNASEDPQIRTGVTPEAQKPLFTTSAYSSDTAQPSTSCAVILEESAGSDKEWNDMLNDWYEQTIGSPRIAPNRGGACNVEPVLEHGEAFSHVSTYATVTENSGLPVPASSSGACHSIPSTSRGSIEEIIQGYDARIGTASTQTGKHKDISGTYSHVNHGMITSGERSHMCELCGNSFKTNHHLATHRRTHTGEKPYHCDMCGKSFSVKYSLDVHRRTHTGEKPFKCTTCTMSFTQKGNLRVHERTHTREKPFKCATCTKSFTHQRDLRVHERTHTGERPYKCKMCEYSSTASSNLKKHQRTHRNKKP